MSESMPVTDGAVASGSAGPAGSSRALPRSRTSSLHGGGAESLIGNGAPRRSKMPDQMAPPPWRHRKELNGGVYSSRAVNASSMISAVSGSTSSAVTT